MKGTRKLLEIIICVLLFFCSSVPVYSRSVEKQAVLAVLTLNLTRFTSWPERAFEHNKSEINLCVIGDNVVQQSFVAINNKVVNNKNLVIFNITRLRNLSQCHLLYVSGLESNKLVQVLLELKGLPVLTVGENMAFLEAGGMVALEKNEGKMQLNFNLPIIKQSELVVSSRILKLAKIFDFPYPSN